MAVEYVDVLIVGAGISGIGSACHLQKKCPDKSFAILEGRQSLGGTWDLFRYPGIRSDSDMYTLGYNFKPWTHTKSIADASTILDYLRETVTENRLSNKIRYEHKVISAAWSDEDARWVLEIERGENAQRCTIECGFLHMCSGYYNYDKGFTPEFAGRESFKGQIVHPQFWPEDIDYKGKKIAVIGSGATAVTIVPAMAKTAEHVTMVQRSPSYLASGPAVDKFANRLRSFLPSKWAYFLTRWKNILMQRFVYNAFQRWPEKSKEKLIGRISEQLGKDYDVGTHFTPNYNPWDQRLCLVPDNDMFEAIANGSASVVTDHIDTFTEDGLRLKSGAELEADIIVTATGINMQFLSDVELRVNGEVLEPNKALSYKGLMVSNVPNMAISVGYTNASWTLKCDLTCDYVCRLLNYMDEREFKICRASNTTPQTETEPYWNLSSGYMTRAQHLFPQQGLEEPWRQYHNYLKDIFMLRYKPLNDGVLEFSN